MVENGWLTASEARRQLIEAYVGFTGQPIIETLRAAQTDLQSFIAAADAQQSETRLDVLRTLHATACAMRVTAALEMCEELLLTALQEGKLPARPTKGFRFSPTIGSTMGVGLYGQARTVPVRFWQMLRESKPQTIDWKNGNFAFGTFIVHAAFGSADAVEFRRVEFLDITAELGRLLGVTNEPIILPEQAPKVAKQGRPKGAGGWAERDAPLSKKCGN